MNSNNEGADGTLAMEGSDEIIGEEQLFELTKYIDFSGFGTGQPERQTI